MNKQIPPCLEHLFEVTHDLVKKMEDDADDVNQRDDEPGVVFGKEVLPRFAEACRNAVRTHSFEIVRKWHSLLKDAAFVGLIQQSAGEIEVFEHRRAALPMLLKAVFACEDCPFPVPIDQQLRIAKQLAADCTSLVPAHFPQSYWFHLISYLGTRHEHTVPARVTTYFPIALNVDVKLGQGRMHPSCLMQWTVEAVPGGSDDIHLHPENLLARCIGDDKFAGIFTQAIQTVQYVLGGNVSLPTLRARLSPVHEQHEELLRELLFEGPSGAGALAIAIFAFVTEKKPNNKVAFSLALDPTNATFQPVGHLEDKIDALGFYDFQTFVIPSGRQNASLQRHVDRAEIELRRVVKFQEAATIAFAPTLPRKSTFTRRDLLKLAPATSLAAIAGAAGGWYHWGRRSPAIEVSVLYTQDVCYYTTVKEDFIEELSKRFHVSLKEKMITKEQDEHPEIWESYSKDLIRQFKINHNGADPSERPPHYFVAIGTKATKVMRHNLAVMDELGKAPFVYIGVTDPERLDITKMRNVDGVRYGPGIGDMVKKIHTWFPDRMIHFLYVDDPEDFPMDRAAAATLAKLPAFTPGLQLHPMKRHELRNFAPSWDPATVICFGWYSLDRLLSDARIPGLSRFPIISSSKATTFEQGLVLAAIAPRVIDLASYGAQIIIDHMVKQQGLDGKRPPWEPSYHHWIDRNSARSLGVPIPANMEQSADVE